MSEPLKKYAKLVKADPTHNVVLGMAIVCTENGQPYVDLQGDHIPEDVMFDCAVDYAKNSRTVLAMHEGGPVGSTLFALPLTSEVAAALELKTHKTGLIIGVHVEDAGTMARFRFGELTGFSIGGTAESDDEES